MRHILVLLGNNSLLAVTHVFVTWNKKVWGTERDKKLPRGKNTQRSQPIVINSSFSYVNHSNVVVPLIGL